MKSVKNIVVIVGEDQQPSSAIQRGVALAKGFGARLHLVSLISSSTINLLGKVSDTASDMGKSLLLARRRDWLEECTISLCEQGIAADAQVIWESPDEAHLVEHLVEQQPDLVIKAFETPHKWHLPLLPSVDQALLCGCPYPLMLVREDSRPLPRKILAAVDPVREDHCDRFLNERVLHAARTVALQCDANCSAVSVIDYSDAINSKTKKKDIGAVGDAVIKVREQHREMLARLAQAASIPDDRLRVVTGIPSTAIIKAVDETCADLLVIGTQYRQGIDRIVLGGTAKALAAQQPCDLLAIKPRGIEEEARNVDGVRPFRGRPEHATAERVLPRR